MAQASRTYEARRTAQSTLHQIVLEHFQTFRAQAASLRDGEGLPRFVEQEFREFLRRGCLRGGFARFRCAGCGHDRLVPFSLTTHLKFDPIELLERLAALTPRPWVNLILYYGILAPRAASQSQVVAQAPNDDGDAPATESSPPDGDRRAQEPRRAGAYLWADLMAGRLASMC